MIKQKCVSNLFGVLSKKHMVTLFKKKLQPKANVFLWPKATTFENSQKYYLQLMAAIFCVQD